ncbi:hypothetical protein [Treponema sp. R80B11-R83G3]
MKRKFIMAFLGIAICGAVLYAQTLDEAILTAAITISRELPAGASVAVINFNSDSKNLNEYAVSELHGALLRGRSVMPVQPNVSQFQTIQGELNTAGELNIESVKSIGKLLEVQYLITGSIKKNDSLYDIVFNAVNMDAEIKSRYQASLNPRGDTQLASLLNINSQPSAVSATTSASKQKPSISSNININSNITGVTVPEFGKTPVTDIETAQYIGTVTWSPEVSGTFASATQYTATITLTAKTGYTFEGVRANFFKVAGAKATNSENSGVVTAVFPSAKEQNAKLNTLGVSIGIGGYETSYYHGEKDYFITTVHGTLAPSTYSFFELGMDIGWEHTAKYYDGERYYDGGGIDERWVSFEVSYLYPFVNYALFVPFPLHSVKGIGGGWYIGLGLGKMIANYTFEDVGSVWAASTDMSMNFFTGFNIFGFDISYTLSTSFHPSFINDYFWINKISFGYVYRFK